MPAHKDWLPHSRAAQIDMARDWSSVLNAATIAAWKIPEADVTELDDLLTAAEEMLKLVTSKDRTETITAQCNEAFAALIEKMRYIKSHYFLVPPLLNSDLVSLQLTPKETSHTPVPPPTDQAAADVSHPGEHLVKLRLHAVAASTPNPHRSDYGFRIYYGVLPLPGTVSNVPISRRELVQVPVSGDELPHSRFTRRREELFDFPQEDRGKNVYFCIRYENAKGEPGPWGPLFSAIIS
ncbi:MAG: hypothetical protein LBU34_02655 [Planctomycetaceae bacterium]|jgi:hypothetical protein|nr:hypothetical protein [Planctomycetaceae bacterium]